MQLVLQPRMEAAARCQHTVLLHSWQCSAPAAPAEKVSMCMHKDLARLRSQKACLIEAHLASQPCAAIVVPWRNTTILTWQCCRWSACTMLGYHTTAATSVARSTWGARLGGYLPLTSMVEMQLLRSSSRCSGLS